MHFTKKTVLVALLALQALGLQASDESRLSYFKGLGSMMSQRWSDLSPETKKYAIYGVAAVGGIALGTAVMHTAVKVKHQRAENAQWLSAVQRVLGKTGADHQKRQALASPFNRAFNERVTIDSSSAASSSASSASSNANSDDDFELTPDTIRPYVQYPSAESVQEAPIQSWYEAIFGAKFQDDYNQKDEWVPTIVDDYSQHKPRHADMGHPKQALQSIEIPKLTVDGNEQYAPIDEWRKNVNGSFWQRLWAGITNGNHADFKEFVEKHDRATMIHKLIFATQLHKEASRWVQSYNAQTGDRIVNKNMLEKLAELIAYPERLQQNEEPKSYFERDIKTKVNGLDYGAIEAACAELVPAEGAAASSSSSSN